MRLLRGEAAGELPISRWPTWEFLSVRLPYELTLTGSTILRTISRYSYIGEPLSRFAYAPTNPEEGAKSSFISYQSTAAQHADGIVEESAYSTMILSKTPAIPNSSDILMINVKKLEFDCKCSLSHTRRAFQPPTQALSPLTASAIFRLMQFCRH